MKTLILLAAIALGVSGCQLPANERPDWEPVQLLATHTIYSHTDSTHTVVRRIEDTEALLELDSTVTDRRTGRVLHRTFYQTQEPEQRTRLGNYAWHDGYNWKIGR